MTTGSPPTDDGALTLSITEKEELEKQYPVLAKYIKPFIGAKEFLHDNVNSYSRYCLWFKDGNVSDYVNIKEITEKVHPYGIDISSGIETDGYKDLKKMKEIMQITGGRHE